MVHPSELLRTNSNETRTFSAPRAEYQLDCGLTNLPILNRCCNLERFAEIKVFLAILSLVGFLQGVTLTYFRETARLWGKHYNVSQENIDWLIYTNEFFIGIFAVLVAYYGNKIHRVSWIGGLTIFQAIASGLLLVPEIYRKNYKEHQNLTGYNLCPHIPPTSPRDTEVNYIALTVLGVYQIFFAMATISFIAHGMTYLDDNSSMKASPGYIGIALASKELGKQAGLYFSWIPAYFKVSKVFTSPVWLCIVSAVFILGVIIAMFPKSMPSTLVRTLSASLVDLASGYTMPPRQQPAVDGFFKTFFRLLRSKVLMVNIFCAVFMQAGLINFNIFENYFKQAQFHISHENDTSYTQFTTNILKQPLVAISIIAAGFVAAKTKPHLQSLVKWNIAATVLVIIFFGSTAFLRCEPKTKYDIMFERNDVNSGCNCKVEEFQPVCMKDKTYYSPCFAGCMNVSEANSRKTFIKCHKSHTEEAVEGPCDETKCVLYYALSQVNRIFTTALLASTLVTNIIIDIRCVLPKDKAAALGLEATFIALITYLPVRAIYGSVAEHYCVYPKYNREVCRLYSKALALFLSLCTMGFMVVSLILACIVLIFLKIYPILEKDDDEDDNEEDHHPVELRDMSTSAREDNRLMNNRSHDEVDSGFTHRSGSGRSFSDSLLEMENVGDDHDSIDSASHLDDARVHRGRVIESDL